MWQPEWVGQKINGGLITPKVALGQLDKAQERPNVLIMMIGLPRSGKSTYARKLGYPIVSPDAIRLALHGQPFIAKAEPWVWATAHLMAESLFLAGHKVVILDACNVSQQRRDEWEKPNSVWGTVVHVFCDTDLNECLSRAVSDPDLQVAIWRQSKAFDWVMPPKGMAAFSWVRIHDGKWTAMGGEYADVAIPEKEGGEGCGE